MGSLAGLERNRIQLHDCVVDLNQRGVSWGNREASLTAQEAQLLRYLERRQGCVIPKEEFLEQVWGYRTSVVSRAINKTMYRLRNKIEGDSKQPVHLHRVRGGVPLRGRGRQPAPMTRSGSKKTESDGHKAELCIR